MIMNIKRILIFLLILTLVTPAIHAEDDSGIYLGDYGFIFGNFDNCTKINQETIGPGSVTTIHNITMHWKNALKITYKNNEGKQDYFIVWKTNLTEEYHFLRNLHELTYHYSDYVKDNNNVVYVDENGENVYGIIVDTQNISYNEEEFVHGILGYYDYELTNSGYHYNPPIDVHDASPHDYHPHTSSRGEQWDMAINDPDWYYEHYDYGDNGEIDQYLYENYEYYE